jgi:hypothetical protein
MLGRSAEWTAPPIDSASAMAAPPSKPDLTLLVLRFIVVSPGLFIFE